MWTRLPSQGSWDLRTWPNHSSSARSPHLQWNLQCLLHGLSRAHCTILASLPLSLPPLGPERREKKHQVSEKALSVSP